MDGDARPSACLRRTVAGDLVTSMSHLRMASTSPIRAEVPSMTSLIRSS